jgi:protein disulfide-isomerase A6
MYFNLYKNIIITGGHCKSLVPEWESAAKTLKGVVKVGALDGTTAESIMRKYDVKGFPSLKIFGQNKKSPTDYQGDRKADAIVSAGLKAVTDMVKSRTGKSGTKDKKTSSGKKKGSDVFELTEENFPTLVMESQDMWLVEFFAPWCKYTYSYMCYNWYIYAYIIIHLCVLICIYLYYILYYAYRWSL